MKIIKILSIFAFTSILIACEDDDATLTQGIQGQVERGAVLRTLASNTVYNFFDTTTEFTATIQAQDIQDGGLMESVDVFVRFDDRTPDNQIGGDRDEVLVENIPASSFTIDEFGLPRTDLSLVFADALSLFNLTIDDVIGGDRFVVRLALNLTDGRVFTEGDVNNSVRSGSFFRSPFVYFVDVACIPVIPFAGEYTVDMQDSFGDGWNGATLTINLDGDETVIFVSEEEEDKDSFTFTVPEGAQSLVFTYSGGSFDEEVTFQIIFNGNVIAADVGPSPSDGPVTLNICPDNI